MANKAQGAPDMPLSTPATVKAMLEVQAHWRHLVQDLELLKGFVDVRAVQVAPGSNLHQDIWIASKPK